jgi:hypothetical protein
LNNFSYISNRYFASIAFTSEVKMKNFIDWATETKKELPVFILDEKTKRGGIATWAYPDAYVRNQYPDSYFLPIAADALFKLKGGKAKG